MGSIHPSFPLRGRWERRESFSKGPLPSQSRTIQIVFRKRDPPRTVHATAHFVDSRRRRIPRNFSDLAKRIFKARALAEFNSGSGVPCWHARRLEQIRCDQARVFTMMQATKGSRAFVLDDGLLHNSSTEGKMKKYTVGILLAVAVTALITMGMAATHWLHVNAAPRGSVARRGGQGRVVRIASNGVPAPPFLVPDLDGKMISTADWHGKVVLLNFWATWCPPCREEIPEMNDLASRFKDQLQIIGVSMDDAPPQEVKEFAKRFEMNYSVIMASREIIEEYGGVPALPTSFVISPEGRVVQKHVGLFPIGFYDTEIRALLRLPVDATIETFQDTGQIFLKNASLATDLPGVDFKGLTDNQKKAALKRLNSEICDCGCRLTLAQCRINDTSCPVSRQLAAKIVKEVLGAAAAPSSGSQATSQ